MRRTVRERWKPAAVVALTAALFTPLLIFGGPAFARTGSAAHQYHPSTLQYKMTICHRTHSKKHPWVKIRISSRALKAHLRHGDTTTLPCPTTLSALKHAKHGNKGKHGEGNQGNQNQGNGKHKENGDN